MVAEALNSMKKDTGLSLEDDLLPGLKGDLEFAIYPGPKTPEFLAYCDAENGGNPVALAEKVVSSIQAHSSKWGNVTVMRSQDGDASEWKVLIPKAQNASLGGANNAPDHLNLISLNGCVYATSEDDLSAKVMALGHGGASLADDGPFVNMLRSVTNNCQALLMVSMYRIMGSVVQHGGDASLAGMFGGSNTGIFGSMHYDNGSATGDLFIPLDWTKVVQMIGKGMKSVAGPPSGSPGGIS